MKDFFSEDAKVLSEKTGLSTMLLLFAGLLLLSLTTSSAEALSLFPFLIFFVRVGTVAVVVRKALIPFCSFLLDFWASGGSLSTASCMASDSCFLFFWAVLSL
jgi:hypothetical protein